MNEDRGIYVKATGGAAILLVAFAMIGLSTVISWFL